MARITSPTRKIDTHCIRSCRRRWSAASHPWTIIMKIIKESAPPAPVSSAGLFCISYNIGIIPLANAAMANIIPLFERRDNHMDTAVKEIIEIPSSQDTMSLDHLIQGPNPIMANTRGVNVATDHPNITLPFNLFRYMTWPKIRIKQAANWTYIASAEGDQSVSEYGMPSFKNQE